MSRIAKTNEAGATSVRPKRTPVGLRPRLHLDGKDPNFEYRWVNDTPGNVANYKRHGWQVCSNEEVDTGNYRAEQASEMGSLAYAIVDGGNGMKAYVMKISKEEYKEIQDALEYETRRTEDTMQPNFNDGEYVKVVIDRSRLR